MKSPCALTAFSLLAATALAEPGTAPPAREQTHVIIGVGAPGEEAYGDQFTKWATAWQSAGKAAQARVSTLNSKDATSELQRLLQAESKATPVPLWISLLGHGSVDAKEPKFNFEGEDLSANQLAEWLKPFERPIIIVCGFSASGAWLQPLARKGRIVVTATKSGSENNFARFGGHFATAISDRSGDLDHDGETSVLEAWLHASHAVTEFYASEGRIATEHALLDDTGDGIGTPPNFFDGIRAVKQPAGGKGQVDGTKAHQFSLLPAANGTTLSATAREQRDALETELRELRAIKATLPEREYLKRLEAILLRLARVYAPET